MVVPDFLNIPYPFIDYKFLKKYIQKFYKAYNLLEDDFSKKTYISFINSKLNEDVKFLMPVVKKDHLYFPSSEFQISNKENLLDIGGFNGDTIRDFVNICGRNFNSIISLEPLYETHLELRNYNYAKK